MRLFVVEKVGLVGSNKYHWRFHLWKLHGHFGIHTNTGPNAFKSWFEYKRYRGGSLHHFSIRKLFLALEVF